MNSDIDRKLRFFVVGKYYCYIGRFVFGILGAIQLTLGYPDRSAMSIFGGSLFVAIGLALWWSARACARVEVHLRQQKQQNRRARSLRSPWIASIANLAPDAERRLRR